ncbi:MAG: ChaN family lipoprotein [Coleofasciculaceae cyanobacterium]
MRKCKIIPICAWSLGIFFLCTTSTYAQTSTPSQQAQMPLNVPNQNILQELAKANVVYLGETHDSLEDHKAQLQILQALHQQNQKIAIAMEIFQRPYQNIVDQYLIGKITEAQLVEQTEYEQRWGFSWEYYAPILRFAKLHQLPVLALNTPTEVTRQVARNGLESLTPEELKYIPPLTEIKTDNADYRKMALASYEQHSQAGKGNSASFERFFTALVLWDETMAEKIAQFVKDNPDYQVVVLAGKSHIIYGYGIPSRIARRLDDKLIQRSVLFAVPENRSPNTVKASDYLWQHQ